MWKCNFVCSFRAIFAFMMLLPESSTVTLMVSSNPQITAALNVSRACGERILKSFVADGLERALNEDPRPGQKRKLDGRAEATLIATACSEAPEGHEHWTLRLLAGKLVQSGVVDTISHKTVRRTLKKTS
jgi:transposase